MEKYLPLGSVVTIKSMSEKVVIISRGMVLPVENNQYFVDYGACLYPYGLVNDRVVYFNHEDIDEVLHLGYQDVQNDEMINLIKEQESVLNLERLNVAKLRQQ